MQQKFRVWDPEAEEMHEPPHGLLLNGNGRVITGDSVEMREYTPMFYTGLTDAEGREIYKGDIVEDNNGTRWIVEWDDEHGMYSFETYEGLGDWAYIASLDSLVIGDKYRNPDLLEKHRN